MENRSSKEKDEVIFVCGAINNAIHGSGLSAFSDVNALTKAVVNLRNAFQVGFAAYYDDEEHADDVVPVVSESQKSDLMALVKLTHTDLRRVCSHFRIRDLDELPANRFAEARGLLEKKVGAMRP